MRNLKRALCLALASVMSLGMMVVGSSAAKVDAVKDFTDASEIQNVEAATINSSIGIFKGMDPEKGVFDPTGIVNRGQMAVIVSKMLGQTDDSVKAFVGTNSFTDKASIPEWAQGWVDYAAANKIIVGRTDGAFHAEDQVTTVEAAVMLCKTLGYFATEKDFGENWKLAVTNKANDLGLYGDLALTVDAGLTRDNVSELVFHGLTECNPVRYNATQDTYYNTDQGWIGGYVFNYANTLAYKNFNLLYSNVDKENQETSLYGRPTSKVWGIGKLNDTNLGGTQINGNGNLRKATINLDQTLYIEAAEADYVWTDVVSNKDVYTALGSTVANTYTFYANSNYVYANTKDTVTYSTYAIPKSSDAKGDFPNSAAGRITEIYVDTDDDTIKVIQIDQYLSEIAKVGVDDVDGAYVELKNGDLPSGVSSKYFTDQTFSKGDKVIFTLGHKDGTTTACIASVYAATKVEAGKVTAVGKDGVSVSIDGTRYNTNVNYTSDVKKLSVNDTYALYLDNNGFVVGTEKVEGSSSNYLYVLKANSTTGLKVGYQDVEVRFADGTKKTIQVDGSNDTDASNPYATEKNVYSYTESNGVYKLKKIDDKVEDLTPATVKQSLKELGYDKNTTYTIQADAKTIYVNTDNGNVYEGVDKVPTFKVKDSNPANYSIKVDVIYDKPTNEKPKDGSAWIATATYVFIDGSAYKATENTSNEEYVYVTLSDADKYDNIKIGDDDYKSYVAYQNGQKIELNVKDGNDTKSFGAGVNEIKRNSDGNVTEGKTYGTLQIVSDKTDTALTIGGKVYKYTDDCKFTLVDGNDVREADASDVIGINEVASKEDYTKAIIVTAKDSDNTDGSRDVKEVFLVVTQK